MALQLGAQTHFGQGWQSSLLNVAEGLGVDVIRDGLPWALVETAKGKFDFSIPQVAWLQTALAQNIPVTLTFAHTNALYDGGNTVYTDAGRAAFANFVVETLKRFPNVSAIEIGNEYNSNSFVTGPIATASADKRDDYYAKLVEAVDNALSAAHIDVELIGGATHSIPVDYFADLKALGALDHLDAISIHPYTTPPEQFEDQIEVLRGVIGDDMTIRVTEFGGDFASLAEAPAYLAKMVSVMGAAGIESASWYALAKQSWYPNMELWDQVTGTETPAGAAFETIGALLDDAGTVTRLDAGDFVHFYTFGDHAAVLWGTSGKITLAKGVVAYDLSGKVIAGFDGTLSSDVPIILKSAGTITAASVAFAASPLVADSFEQFDVSNEAGGTSGFEGPWSYFAQSGTGKTVALYTMGGGLKAGEPWTPYLGATWLRPLEVNATTITPADFANGQKADAIYAVVERYTASQGGVFTLKGEYDVGDMSDDGIDLTIRVNGKAVLTQHIYDKANGNTFSFNLEHVALAAGDQVDFVVGSGQNAKGDVTARHIQIFAEQLSADTGAQVARMLPVLDYAASAGPVLVDLAKGRATIDGKSQVISGTDLVGSANGDKLYGDGHANRISGGAGNDNLYGRDGDDVLLGGAGKDRLDGGTGADRMEGGLGNDAYFVDSLGDSVIEDSAKGGVDTVRSSVDFTLGTNVERLYLTGNADADAFGNALDNILKGNAGDNVLNGGAGHDKLQGGAGHDAFVFDSLGLADIVTDFASGTDHLEIDRDAFAGLKGMDVGALDALAYGKVATSPDQHLFYDQGAGVLYYDADGSGGAAAVAIATFTGSPHIAAGDVFLI